MARKRRRSNVVRYKARRGGASPALKKSQGQVISLRSRLRKLRTEGTGVVTVGQDWQNAAKLAFGVNAGAAIAGAVLAVQPTLGGFDTRLLVGAGLMAGGAFLLKGDAAAITVCAGAGMTAGWTQDNVQGMVEDATATTTTGT